MNSTEAIAPDLKPMLPSGWQQALTDCRQRLSLLSREEIDRLADEAIAGSERQSLEVHGAGR